MAKATHTGTCQCCGATQKLPNGKLSKHGYTVEHGWFEGVCFGAGELPFEQSKDLIEGLIERATDRAAELRIMADEYLNNPSAEGIKHSVYVRTVRGMGRHEIIADTLKFETKDYSDGSGTYMVAYWESKGEHHPNNSVHVEWDEDAQAHNDVAATIRSQRTIWYKNLIKQAESAEQYVEWQKERIKNWKPTELTPIK